VSIASLDTLLGRLQEKAAPDDRLKAIGAYRERYGAGVGR
jgi:hypothetical protein